MPRLDPFTQNRLIRFTRDFRTQTGQLPTLRDYEEAGIARETVELGVRDEVLEKFYVTLTSGVVVKGYKLRTQG